MTICSLVLHTRPENLARVSCELEKMTGVEVHGASELGKLVVTVDHPDRGYCNDTMIRMYDLDGVLNAALIYEYQEDSEDSPEDTGARTH